ncbi:BatD family protein [Marinobacter piscensis]|uniref:BatD family protein n=1 Tax=Marinobacter piscensis TaxID=1562308 RepID=UPI00119E3CEF|nr:BatD family protein [Marinobacter piscensis]
MVKRLIIPVLWLMVSMLGWQSVHAGELTAEADKTQLYEGDVLTLTVTGSTGVDISLSNLFDFDISSLPSPDIEQVQPDFEILARNQRYNIRTVNGDMVAEVTWTYQLAPRSTGELTIPALSFQDARSQPLTVSVMEGTPPGNTGSSRDSFIELTADKAEVYVQEQLILTVRLFFQGNLIRGELSEPQHPDAVIEPLGKQREFTRNRDGVRYRVVERRYAVYPQKPRPLNLPAIRFEGQARNADGSLKFLRDSATLFEVPVKDIPAEFSGSTWLPTTGLSLAETGIPDNLDLQAGHSLTRTLSLQASGLPAETLPPLPEAVPDGLRIYPEQPKRDTSIGPDGITSTLTHTRALVPVEPGELTLPAIRIPWWDTESDSEKVAVIPAKTLTVAPAEGVETPAETAEDSKTPPPEIVRPEASTQTQKASDNRTWQWISLALAGAWALTLLAWWRTGRKGTEAPADAVATESQNEHKAFDQLLTAAGNGKAATPGLFVTWACLRWPGHNFRAATEVFRALPEPALEAELDKLQAHLFGRTHSGSAQKREQWNGKRLVSALKTFRGKEDNPRTREGLPPLYPDKLSVTG